MRAWYVLIALVMLPAAVAASQLRLPPPTSRVAREVVVFWLGTGRSVRFSEPGRHEVEFRCSHRPDADATIRVNITRHTGRSDGAPSGYRVCTAAEVRKLAGKDGRAQVQFEDVFAEQRFAGGQRPRIIHLPDGQRVPVVHAFSTRSGLLCLVPREAADLEVVRAAMPGDSLQIRGQTFRVPPYGPCVLADAIGFGEPLRDRDEPPWTVRVRWRERDVLVTSEPGDRIVELPCEHEEGATERLGLRLRELKVVDLQVKGNRVSAELADSPGTRRNGLQGRRGLRSDEGMLFFFPAACRPRFVMKSVSFPISVAFIRADGVITDIGRMSPGDQRGVVPSVPVNYVLEMEQGWFRDHGVAPGDEVPIP